MIFWQENLLKEYSQRYAYFRIVLWPLQKVVTMVSKNKFPKKKIEECLQEQLYIDDFYYIPKEALLEHEQKDEEIERGVIVIDLM